MTQARYRLEAEYVERMAESLSERTGEFLFKYLRHGIAQTVRGTKFDTFDEDMSFDEILRYLEQHIEYNDDGNMTMFRNGDDILWEEGVNAR